MAVTDSFVTFVLEQLEPLGPIASKRMFGGVGLYAGDLFFALIAGDVLYLKTDTATRDAREKAGARQFQPFPDRPKGKGGMQVRQRPGRDPRGRRGAAGVGEGVGRHRRRKELSPGFLRRAESAAAGEEIDCDNGHDGHWHRASESHAGARVCVPGGA